MQSKLAGWPVRPSLIEDEALKRDAMVAGTVALACSGTVTTELALAGCPMVVAYRVGPLTYEVLKRLVRTRYITLFNIAAGEAIAPEMIQQACNGPALAAELTRRLDDPELRARQSQAQTDALDRMGRGQGDPASRAAEVVIETLRAKGLL